MIQYFLFILLSTTSVKANTGCTGNYQYERQPLTSFTHCNPVKTVLSLECAVLVPSDSTTVTVDWYWSKNISECGSYITEEQGRFTITTMRASSHLLNVDRITTDLIITSPQTDTGYYWCQVNDPSYNGVFTSSNKASVFDTGTMTNCSGTQSTLQTKCAVGSVPSLICVIPTSSFVHSITAVITTHFQSVTSSITTILTGSSTIVHVIYPTSSTSYNMNTFSIMDVSPYTTYMTPSSDITSMTSSLHTCHNEGLISGLIVLSVIMFILGGVLGGLLTILWNKRRYNKDLNNPTSEEKESIPKQVITEVNTAYGLTVFSQDTSVTDHPSDYLCVYDTPQQ